MMSRRRFAKRRGAGVYRAEERADFFFFEKIRLHEEHASAFRAEFLRERVRIRFRLMVMQREKIPAPRERAGEDFSQPTRCARDQRDALAHYFLK